MKSSTCTAREETENPRNLVKSSLCIRSTSSPAVHSVKYWARVIFFFFLIHLHFTGKYLQYSGNDPEIIITYKPGNVCWRPCPPPLLSYFTALSSVDCAMCTCTFRSNFAMSAVTSRLASSTKAGQVLRKMCCHGNFCFTAKLL